MSRTVLTALLLALLLPACAFHELATEWHGRLDTDGKPVYFVSTTKVGVRLFVIIPFLGSLGIGGMVDELTEEISERGGDHVDIVQADTEAYWWAIPGVTWIFTPVVSTLAATYRPSQEQLAADLAKMLEQRDEVAPDAPEPEEVPPSETP